jgi:hypothetical protein
VAPFAVEVRRLNQTHDDGNGARGLEEDAIPLWKSIGKYLEQLGPGPGGETWFVFVRWSRPLPKKKLLEQELDSILKHFMVQEHRRTFWKTLPSGIRITVFPTPNVRPTFYRLGGGSDAQAGGRVLEQMEKNLKLHVTDKTNKVAAYRTKYPIWWLVLVDQIGHGLDDLDREQFRNTVQISHNFDRVILVDPSDASRAMDV